MSNYVPPADKASGATVTAEEWNALKNGIASYLNNENIGNSGIHPTEKISGAKVDLTLNPTFTDHSARHEPGGPDEVGDIDIANSGTPVSNHHTRHATGGADAMTAASLDGSVLIPGSIPQGVTVQRKKQESFIQNALGLAAGPLYPRLYTLGTYTSMNSSGRGVIRGGFLYVCGIGATPNAIYKIDIDAGTETKFDLAAGQTARGLVLIGTDIYVLTYGAAGAPPKNMIRKLNNNDILSDVVDLNSGAAPNALVNTQHLRCNGDGTRLFCIASDSSFNYIIGVDTDGTDLTKSASMGATAKFGLAYGKRGSDERLWFIEAGATLYRRLLTGAADGSLALGGVTARRLLYDGEHLIVANNGASSIHQIVDPWAATMKVILLIPTPTTVLTTPTSVDNLDLEALGDFDLFDGRAAHFHGRSGTTPEAGLISIYPSDGYRAVARLTSHGGSYGPSSLAADQTYIYANYNTAGADCRIRRILRD